MEATHSGPSELDTLRTGLFGEIDGEGKRLKVCLLATFLLGLIAHGFGLTNLLIGHDSLHEFYWTVSRDWKFTLGRFMEPILRYAMGEIMTLTWLTGLAGLLFIGLSVHLISKIFALNQVWENILLAGVCVTNITVSAIIATYVHDFAGDMLALLLACMAAWAWWQMEERFSWKHLIFGAVCLMTSAGFYQAYLAVFGAVVVLYAIRRLLNGGAARETVIHLVKAVPMAALGMIAYFACVAVTQRLFHVGASTGDPSNDLTTMGDSLRQVVPLALQSYGLVLRELFTTHYESIKGVHDRYCQLVALVNILLALGCGWLMAGKLKKRGKWEIMLTLVLTAALPLAMSCVSIFSPVSHNLVRYAYYLYYLLILILLADRKRWQQLAAMALISVVLFSNIQVSNAAYEKKELEQQATLSTMTRVLTRLESCPDYTYDESEVAILGMVGTKQAPLTVGPLIGIAGLENVSPITYAATVEDYFRIVLQYPIHIVEAQKQRELMNTGEYQNMGIFPAVDSITVIDGVIVVKMA